MILTGVLEYVAATPDVTTELEHVVPSWAVPFVPIVIGGLATVASVHRASNDQPQSDEAPSVEVPAPGRMAPAPAAAPAAAAAATPPGRRPSTTAAAAPAGLPDQAWWPQVGAPQTGGTSVLAVPRAPASSLL